jgi:hypothetical protein
MSVQIDSPDELQKLLKKCNLRVGSIEELKDLLASINASYNPDAARVKAALAMSVAVPCTALGVAGMVSFLVSGMTEGLHRGGPYPMIALAVMWGCAALVSILALVMGMVSLRARRGGPATGAPADIPRAGVAVHSERSTNVIPADQLARPVP